MKITVTVDCTPQEARQFFGLPDVEAMQRTMMAEVEKKMMVEMDRYSPDGLMRTWLSAAPQNAEWLQQIFGPLFQQARGAQKPDP